MIMMVTRVAAARAVVATVARPGDRASRAGVATRRGVVVVVAATGAAARGGGSEGEVGGVASGRVVAAGRAFGVAVVVVTLAESCMDGCDRIFCSYLDAYVNSRCCMHI